VNPTSARRRIRELVRAGRYFITGYCALRLLQRAVTEGDVVAALSDAAACWAQANGRWKVEGEDEDGEALFLIVELQQGVVVVTAYRGDEGDDDED
jgi:hypothetical protein